MSGSFLGFIIYKKFRNNFTRPCREYSVLLFCLGPPVIDCWPVHHAGHTNTIPETTCQKVHTSYWWIYFLFSLLCDVKKTPHIRKDTNYFKDLALDRKTAWTRLSTTSSTILSNFYDICIFNRPGVTGAVLQTSLSLISWLHDWLTDPFPQSLAGLLCEGHLLGKVFDQNQMTKHVPKHFSI